MDIRIVGVLSLFSSSVVQAAPCTLHNELPDIIKCAEEGDSMSQDLLGQIYYLGKEVPKNYTESFKWTLKAAKQGDTGAESQLGFDYYNGWGTSKNHVLAYTWWSLAIVGADDPVLRKNMNDLEAELSPSELAAAQQAAEKLSKKTRK